MGNRYFALTIFLFLFLISWKAYPQISSRNKNIVRLLCILDGEVIFNPDSSLTVLALEQLDAGNLGFTHQIKPETAFKLYGQPGRNGAYLVYTKNTPDAFASTGRYLKTHIRNYGSDPFLIYKKLYPKDSLIDGTHLKKGQFLPQFPGGNAELNQFISEKLHYPVIARSNFVMGKVIIGFIINESGKISDMTIVKGKDLGGGLGDEALALCKSLPAFYPGTDKGIPVKTFYTIPFNYSLDLVDETP